MLPKQAPREFLISNGGQIVTDSEGTGIGGNIFLISQALELDNGSISALTQVQIENTVAQVCGADAAIANANSFTIKGKGGVPPTPESPFSLYNISTDNLSAIPEPQTNCSG